MVQGLVRLLPVLLGFSLIISYVNAETDGVKITQVLPHEASTGGATRITIYGGDFASSEFNHGEGNEGVGNKVALVSLTRSYDCEVHKDGTTEKQIVCITTARMAEDDYYVKVKVDGEDVPKNKHCNYWRHWKCVVKVRHSYTPSITSISPHSGPPDSAITVKGKLFSDRRGNHLAASSNGLEERFLRIYVGGYECILLIDPDDDKKFQVKLDSETSNNGEFTCTINSKYVYNQNVSFIIEGKYGRSRPNLDIIRPSADDKLYTFQSYAEITSVSPSSISTAGGATLTISGKNFDETKSKAAVHVGGVICDVTSVTASEILCTVPAEPSAMTRYSGNRGLDQEFWSSSGITNLADVLDLSPSVSSNHTEDLKVKVPAGMTTRVRSVFVPPSDNMYHFRISSSGVTSKLYFSDNATDMTEIASSSSRTSAKQNLMKGTRYFLDFVGQSSSDSEVQVGVCVSATKFTSGMTGAATAEKQKIAVRSTVKKEIQTVNLAGFMTGSGTSEVQTVTVTGADSTFRLGIDEVYTVPLAGDADADAVTAALLALPGTLADSVGVAVQTISNGNRYTVTFVPGLGDVPLMTAMTEPNARGETLTVTVQETTKGVPSAGFFSPLVMDDISSTPVPVDSSESKIRDAVWDMFVEMCPSAVDNPARSAYFESFENSRFSRVMTYDEKDDGTVIRAFCGKSFQKNPWDLYRASDDSGLYLSQYKTVCFGYLGGIQSQLYLYYTYTDSDNEKQIGSKWFQVADIVETTSWRYICVDMMALVSGVVTGGSRFFLHRAVLARLTDQDIYVDSVYIGAADTTADFNGLNEGWTKRRQALPSGHMINDVSLTSSGSLYTIELTPNECGNDFEIFGVKGAQVTSGSNGRSSLSVIYSYGGGTVNISVTEEASPPVTGQFDLTFMGKTKTVPAKTTAMEFQDILHAIGAAGTLVTRGENCANYDWIITWAGKGGDQSDLEISSASLSGIGVTITASTMTDGMLCYDPIPAELLRTVHEEPQVSVNINGIPSACVGEGSCTLEWSSASTPTVTAVTPTSGTLATSITITGTKFSSTPSENTVIIGGTACTVQSAIATSITCDVGNGPKGSYEVAVTVSGLGLAAHPPNAPITFTYVADVQSISPTSGSVEGGTDLNITGYGFRSGAVVTVGGEACLVTSNTPALIQCVTPKATTRADSSVDLIVTQDGVALTSKTFSYSLSETATISSVSPTTSAVQGGIEITISGSGFGSTRLNDEALMIGDKSATITHYSDTEVRGTLPGQAPGSYPVRLKASTSGYADTREHSIGDISYVFEVTNIFPKRGSLLGGTNVIITGRGFSTTPGDNVVTLGHHPCTVQSSSDVQIKCTIDAISKVHTITNKGQSPNYGAGFAWDTPVVTVEVGDTVRWEWSSDPTLDLKYRVQRTTTLADKTYDETGFSSGSTGTSSGVYQYLFTETGVNYYWSGYVTDDSMIALRGEVDVTAKASHMAYLKVTRGDFEAEYKTSSGVSDPSPEGCSGDTGPIAGCTTAEPTATDSTKFGFAFWECSTPKVNQITPAQGTGVDDIVITGTGFTSTICENEVYIGEYQCETQTSASGQITARVDPSLEVPVGKTFPLTVRVGNRGNALITPLRMTDRSFVALPFVSELTPLEGSMAGGTNLVISGGGFASDASVTLGGYPCSVTSVTYGSISCTTEASTGSAEVVVKTSVDNGQVLDAVCATVNNACVFMYTSAATPTLASATPASVDAQNAEVTITGTGFGTDKSKITVALGSGSCVPSTVSDTQIVCNTLDVPAGTHTVLVSVDGKGLAQDNGVTLGNEAKLSAISPSSGSVYGGTRLTITGNGFTSGVTAVLVGTDPCDTESVTAEEIVCVTPAHAAAVVDLAVTSGSVTFSPSQNFTYSTAQSPQVDSISPTNAPAGDPLTITGSGFTGTPVVTINGTDCGVTSSSATSVVCTLGSHSAGRYPVLVYLAGSGNSNDDVMFEYTIGVTSVTPSSGSFAGGQEVIVAGAGFDPDSSVVTICNETCTLVDGANQTSSVLTCKTPAYLYGDTSNKVCDVTVTVNNVDDVLSGGFTFDTSLTPDITSVTPARGGTAGGTSVTIEGQGFSLTDSENTVTIGGVACTVTSATTTQLVCTTGSSSVTQETTVKVMVANKGEARQTSADFYYVDVWSSQWTWGGKSPPEEGGLVVIRKGQTVLLDTDTPVLKMIIIQGGKLIFDEKDVELQVEIILITDGGLLQIGTEAEPFQHKAIITLHGHLRSKELPIYGTKVLAVREGVLDLHGKPTSFTWSRLESTASAGQNTIVLVDEVDWSAGDSIVIATTGDRHSMKENEKHVIASVASDKKTITLQSPLVYEHLGVTETFDGKEVEFRAEVGLLTRNVVVRGSDSVEWHDEIEACEEGFDTGEFSTQTCFQGRHGDEMGNDQFGGQIILHAAKPDLDQVIGRLEYVEVTYAGQAFRLGRYPVHFHLNGDMHFNSYVRGLGIHQTFNRAVNIHGTHQVLVEHNVAYNVMGGAFFLEDGVETGNIFQYNLLVFVISSTSLLNEDITPAAFWATNPNNTIQHNHAVGGTHFGIWYRMHDHPEGPSFDPNICPKKVPLGVFRNNTVHSQGWFGIWIFQDFFPMEGGGCSSVTPVKAVFESLLVWNCEKGMEFVNGGSIQFNGAIFVNNKKAGAEGKKIVMADEFSPEGPMLSNSMIVARTNTLTNSMGPTFGGIVLPYHQGYTVENVTFVNFDRNNSAALRMTRIAGKCGHLCGGYSYHFSGIRAVNSPNMAIFEWTHEGIFVDKDGTLTQAALGSRVTPTVNTLPSAKCTDAPSFGFGVPASVCEPDVSFVRFSFNKILPSALEYKNVVMTNSHGSDSTKWAKKRISHAEGWMTTLVAGETYNMVFKDGEISENITYTAAFDFEKPTDYVVMKQRTQYKPDRFSFSPDKFINESSSASLSAPSDSHGDWKFYSNDNQLAYLASGEGGSSPLVKKTVNLQAYRCYYDNCEGPPDPNSQPPATKRPSDFTYWSNPQTWIGGNYGNGSNGLPQDGDDVVINKDVWVVVDIPLPRIKTLYVYGTLELDGDLNITTNSFPDHVLSAEYIYIVGGRLIAGWPDNPHKGRVDIILRGSHASPRLDVLGGPEVGAKAIGVFGGLDLHGKEVATPWTTLAVTAEIGANTITVTDTVDWEIGDEIVITPTGYDPWETETFKIVSVSGSSVLGLNSSVQHKHLAFSDTVGSQTYSVTAEVGLLTRNVKVIGEDYDMLYKESFGARVIVGLAADGDMAYLGYARISGVEFYHGGQEGFRDAYDPRFAVSYLDCGKVSTARPSYVKNSAFHHLFSTAIGVFNTHGLDITDNVIHHTVGKGVEVMADSVNLANNLIVLSIFPGTYQDRLEASNIDNPGGIDARKSTNLQLTGNAVSGSERFAYRVPGESCDGVAAWSGNIARSSLTGVGMLPGDGHSICLKIADFAISMCGDYGIYINTKSSMVLSDLTLAGNMLGIFPMVIGPSALAHQTSDKSVMLENSLVVGTGPFFDCSAHVLPSAPYVKRFGNARSNIMGNGALVGMVSGSFTGGSNNAPQFSFKGVMSYNTISGVTYASNVSFSHFGETCGRKDVAIATNPSNDDGIHPMEVRDLQFLNTPEKNKVFFHVPNVRKVNPSDCVDMDCDGLKKCMVIDTDGSLLGTRGTIIPMSEFEWDGDPRRGLGDYRIPKTLLTEADGSRIPVNTIAPNKGIYRPACQKVSDWRAYKCPNTDYRMLIIESMDADTETRRLSPVAVLVDDYIDLINGPQDHGWCSGYTCQKRISTFMSVVPTGKEASIYFTSTSPQNLRLHLLNAGPEEAVLLSIWYAEPYRLDLFLNGNHVLPTNGYLDAQGNYQLRKVASVSDGKPKLTDPTASNFMDMENNLLYVLVKGPEPVDIKTFPVVVVVFEATSEFLTVDEFFGENLVNNLVAFLGVDPSKVRLVDVIAEGSVGGRRRRSTGVTRFVVEVGDPPATSVNGSVNNSMTPQEQQDYLDSIVTGALLGTLNVNATVYAVIEPLPSPSDPAWTYRVVQNETVPPTLVRIEPIDRLIFDQEPVPVYEGKPFSVQPRLKVLNSLGSRVVYLGTSQSPWEMTVTLTQTGQSYPGAVLSGNSTVTFIDGWASFSEMAISHAGTYILEFSVTSPPGAANFTVQKTIVVSKRPLLANIVSQTDMVIGNSTVDFILDLRDAQTMDKIEDLSWRGHTWSVTADLPNPRFYMDGRMSGTPSGVFNPANAQVSFSDLTFSHRGIYRVRFRVTSNPPEYDFYVLGKVKVISARQANIVRSRNSTVEMRFDVNYNDVIDSPENMDYFTTYVGNHFRRKYEDVLVEDVAVREGSILVTFTLSGNSSHVDTVVFATCDEITSQTNSLEFNGQTLTFSSYMKVDGQNYYGSQCGPVKTGTKADDSLHPGIIAAIVIISVMAVVILMAFIFWRFSILPKTKTLDDDDGVKHIGSGPVDTILFRENTFESLRERGDVPPSPMPPSDTTYNRPVSNRSTRSGRMTQDGHFEKVAFQ